MKKSKVLRAARRLIRENGLVNMTLSALCFELEIPEGSFAHHTGMLFQDLVTELRNADTSSKIHPSTKLRVHKDARKDHILKHAMKLAERHGYMLTRDELARAAEVTPSLVTYHFHSIKGLREAIIERAINEENLKVLAQGLANSNPVALAAPPQLKQAAAKFLGAIK